MAKKKKKVAIRKTYQMGYLQGINEGKEMGKAELREQFRELLQVKRETPIFTYEANTSNTDR